jgi:parallel beta-helix repeat protein
MIGRLRTLALVGGAVGALGLTAPVAAGAATRTVDDDGVQCPAAGFTTIQSAVDAAGPGDQINVCRGTYAEDVTIGAGKDGLSLLSSTATAAATVKSPNPFTVLGAQGVSIQKFRIEPTTAGIFAFDGGFDLIRNNLIVGGEIGIDLIGSQADTVRDNTLLAQTLAGVFVQGGSNPAAADVLNNTVTGGTASATFGVIYGASAGAVSGLAFGNTISKHTFAIDVTSGPADVSLKANTVFQNGGGIFITSTVPVEVENNRVNGNATYGIEVHTGGHTLLSNNARSNGGTDCIDTTSGGGTASTANTWTGNYGLDWNVPGICTP